MGRKNSKTKRGNFTEAEYIKSLCQDNPETPNQTLARLAAKQHPDKFTIQGARDKIRYLRGARGKAARKQAIKAGHGGLIKSWDDAKKHLDALPPPEATDVNWNPYNVPGQKILSISDIHFPFHDPVALECALEKGYSKGIDSILINGDLIDFYRISRWTKTMKGRSIEGELRGTYQLLETIRKIWPDAPITWKLGNHEERWELHLAQVSPALWETKLSQIDHIFKNPGMFHEDEDKEYDLGIKWVKMQPMKVGHLWIIHGHEVGRGIFSPVNQARGLFLRTLNCTLAGHGHQTSNHSNKTIDDTVIACWSQGCLCDLHPRYNPISLRWNHGFAIIERTDQKGNFELLNYKIIDGKAYVS
jgi:hypothetical protein